MNQIRDNWLKYVGGQWCERYQFSLYGGGGGSWIGPDATFGTLCTGVHIHIRVTTDCLFSPTVVVLPRLQSFCDFSRLILIADD